MALFKCPYLQGEVECTEERNRHIEERHPDLLPGHWRHITATLATPDEVRRSARFKNARLFSRWYHELGKYVVVVVISEPTGRNWVVTAYMARDISSGVIEWKRG